MRVLIAFASRYGSTRGIGDAIAERLRAAGHSVDVQNAADVESVAAYDAVVLGSAIYNQAWLAEAAQLAQHEARVLADRPLWLFSVGALSSEQRWPLGALARREPKDIARLRRALRPIDYHVFAGAVAPEHLSLVGRLFFKLLKGRYGDYRDWRESVAWADGIARALGGIAGGTESVWRPQSGAA
jgi:menaquinone-dependent protoporphyrinogen oxidase